jgi:hypothetical protein
VQVASTRWSDRIRGWLIGRPPVSADAAALVSLATLFAMAVWLHVDRVSVVLLVGALAAFALAPHLVVPAADGVAAPPLRRADLVRSLPIAAVIVLPVAIDLAAAFGEEFPWSGDHFYHLFASQSVRSWWVLHLAAVAAFAWIPYLLRRAGVRHWALITFAAVLVWARFGEPSPGVARYPAGGYLFELPLRLLINRHDYGEPALLLDRITMALSVLGWLFVARPLVVRRWPDLGVLPFALVFFWQKDFVFYTTSVDLEAWAVVLVLVAVELVMSDLRYRTWLAPLLVGAAAGFKEPAILLLPWICLATLPSLPRTVRTWAAVAVNAFLATLPFLIYFHFRKASGVSRTFSLASDQIFSSQRLGVLGDRLLEQFGAGGLLLLAISMAVLVAMAWRYRERRWTVACLLGAVATEVAFFYVDAASVPYTGYSRFLMFPIAIFAIAAWVPSNALRAEPRFPRIALGAAAAIAVLQATALGPYLVMHAGPDPARNFFEHTDSSVYYPIRELIDEAEAAGAIAPGQTITIQQPGDLEVAMVGAVYPRTGARYGFTAIYTDCRCAPDRPALLVPITYPTGLVSAPGGRPLAPKTAACIAALRETYQRVFERAIDGYPTGLLGVGCRVPSAK